MTKAQVMTFGLNPTNDLWADKIESHGLEGMEFALHHGETLLHVQVPLLGQHSVHTALAAAAVGLAQDLSWEEILTGLQDVSAQLRLIAVPGENGTMLLDDTYNSSPAVHALCPESVERNDRAQDCGVGRHARTGRV